MSTNETVRNVKTSFTLRKDVIDIGDRNKRQPVLRFRQLPPPKWLALLWFAAYSSQSMKMGLQPTITLSLDSPGFPVWYKSDYSIRSRAFSTVWVTLTELLKYSLWHFLRPHWLQKNIYSLIMVVSPEGDCLVFFPHVNESSGVFAFWAVSLVFTSTTAYQYRPISTINLHVKACFYHLELIISADFHLCNTLFVPIEHTVYTITTHICI